MANNPVSLRIPAETRAAIDDTVRRTGRDLSSVVNEMLGEAVKLRRIPGVAFADGANGRVAVIAGTGLEVWEVIDQFRAMGEDWDGLKAGFDWLSDFQLRAALAYAEAYPEEIKVQVNDNASWTPDRVWSRYPFMKPPAR